jgi:hypothetical protein
MDFIYLFEAEERNLLTIALSGARRGLRGRDSGGDLTNVQYKPIWNCHNESPLYNKYNLMVNFKNSIQFGSKCRKYDFVT